MAAKARVQKRLYYKIGEACKTLGIQPYVLRYWETEFSALSPSKSRSGQRVYSEKELEVIRRIKQLLYDECYTIAGAKKKLEGELAAGTLGEPAATAATPPAAAQTSAQRVQAPAGVSGAAEVVPGVAARAAGAAAIAPEAAAVPGVAAGVPGAAAPNAGAVQPVAAAAIPPAGGFSAPLPVGSQLAAVPGPSARSVSKPTAPASTAFATRVRPDSVALPAAAPAIPRPSPAAAQIPPPIQPAPLPAIPVADPVSLGFADGATRGGDAGRESAVRPSATAADPSEASLQTGPAAEIPPPAESGHVPPPQSPSPAQTREVSLRAPATSAGAPLTPSPTEWGSGRPAIKPRRADPTDPTRAALPPDAAASAAGQAVAGAASQTADPCTWAETGFLIVAEPAAESAAEAAATAAPRRAAPPADTGAAALAPPPAASPPLDSGAAKQIETLRKGIREALREAHEILARLE